MKRPLYVVAPLALISILAFNACSTAPAPSAATQVSQATTAPSKGATTASPVAASPAASTTAKPAASPAAQAPKYGGTLNVLLGSDIVTFDDATQGGPGGVPSTLINQEIWMGDWTKGPAGGYGTNDTDWASNGYDIFAMKTGSLAESWQINIDNATNKATVVYKIRPGVRWALNPNSDASKLVGGRELTADDILAAIKFASTDQRYYIYRSNPELRNVDVSKTGPLEITLKVPVENLVTALSSFGDKMRVFPPETQGKTTDWKAQVGTGPFMLTDYKSGSSLTFAKNPNYWMKDPIGPGKGNQLPYIDGIQALIVPDASTRLAAFRTGKVDEIDNLTWEDAGQIKKESPQMPSADGVYYYGNGFAMYMRTDKPPYNDVRVRRALMMATDFNAIKQNINGGRGVIITFPFDYWKEYSDLYVGLDDPDLPAAIKEQFTYSPDKARQLLSDAGFPNGFKTSIMILAAESSYYESIASMWAKVGVTLALDVKDNTTRTNLVNSQAFNDMTSGPGKGTVATYYGAVGIHGTPGATVNMSFVNDQFVDDTLPKIRALAATDERAAMKLARQLALRSLDQAWAIQQPSYRTLTFWWPWLKNYSGEISVGYFNNDIWSQFVWIDQDQKKSMGR